jgi:hypothetical protein
VTDDLSADLDQLIFEARQRPIFDRLWRPERAEEIAEIVGERMELKTDGVGGERAARIAGVLTMVEDANAASIGADAMINWRIGTFARPRVSRMRRIRPPSATLKSCLIGCMGAALGRSRPRRCKKPGRARCAARRGSILPSRPSNNTDGLNRLTCPAVLGASKGQRHERFRL